MLVRHLHLTESIYQCIAKFVSKAFSFRLKDICRNLIQHVLYITSQLFILIFIFVYFVSSVLFFASSFSHIAFSCSLDIPYLQLLPVAACKLRCLMLCLSTMQADYMPPEVFLRLPHALNALFYLPVFIPYY